LTAKYLQSLSKHFIKIIFSSIIILILVTPPVRGDVDPILAAKLQYTIDSVRNYWSYTGVSVAVYIPSVGTWTGTSGFTHSTVRITPEMKFGIASNTKTFISVLMLKLQEMNLLNLDDSLHKWIPGYQHINPNITIRQLLNHTSGLFNYTAHPGFGSAMSDTGRFWTPEEILTTFINQPNFSPGAGFQYSNTNYLIAGMIIKAATGNPVSHSLRELILNPLNLTNTFFPVEESVPDTIAHGWWSGVPLRYPGTASISSAFTSGAMYSTAENMVRFYKELFNLQIINQSSLNQMLTPPQHILSIYGLGIVTGILGGGVKHSHTGGIPGYISFTGIDTSKKYIISVLINQTPSDFFKFIPPLDKVILNYYTTSGNDPEVSLPAEYSLSQNYPNPFNPSTKIKYSLPISGLAKIAIYDLLGTEIATLINKQLDAGDYEIEWNAETLPSGIYFYKLQTNDITITRKMLLLK
jgi:D-alanyl-D-alanine carboxypeptidase